MNRRDWMMIAGASPSMLAAAPAPAEPTVETEIVRLEAEAHWTTTMSSSEFRDTIHFRYTSGGITGRGEGAPIVRYKESAADSATRNRIDCQDAQLLRTPGSTEDSPACLHQASRRVGGEERYRYRSS